MPVESRSRNREVAAILVTTLVLTGAYAFLQSRFFQDLWKSWRYDESSMVSEIRRELELTEKGKRIFLATQPALEEAESFNEHCNSHEVEVSLLGCYTNDQMYIYEVQLPELVDSHKVTAAHELLHAVWARMSGGERKEVEKWLSKVRQENSEWVEEELKLYDETAQMEELYTRVGTKLREIPEELEEHYRKYFQNRLKIVEFYENYQAPFQKLQDENQALREKVLQLGEEIDAGKEEYDRRIAGLKVRIERYNECADTAGCFKSMAEFQKQRAELEAEDAALENLRLELNAKIDENNKAVAEYQENVKKLGNLSDAMNSNVKEKI